MTQGRAIRGGLGIGLVMALLVSCMSFPGGSTAVSIDDGNTPTSSGTPDPTPAPPQNGPGITFEPNQGQTDSQVQFLGRSPGYNLYLTGMELVFDVILQPLQVTNDSLLSITPNITGSSATVSITLKGANKNPKGQGLEPLSGATNYLIGSDPSKWITNITTYNRVEYQDVYPGIGIHFYGQQGRVKHDFIVSPGVNPGIIQMGITGAQNLSLDPEGNLHIQISSSMTLVMQKAIIYQVINGTKIFIEGSFSIGENNTVGFTLEDYDHQQELVIDPATLTYSTFLGGSSDDITWGVALDTTTNATINSNAVNCTVAGSPCAVIVGYTKSANFPKIGGLLPPNDALQGTFDAFVTKLGPSGTINVFTTYLGGTGNDLANSVQVDQGGASGTTGNAYITGYTRSTDFPHTTGVFQIAHASDGGGYDAFVSKLAYDGTSLTYSTYLGGTAFDRGSQIALDDVSTNCTTVGTPCVALIGTTSSTDLATNSGLSTTGVMQTTNAGGAADAFVAHISATGVATNSWMTYLGGAGRDLGTGIAIAPSTDTTGNVYMTGETRSASGTPSTFAGTTGVVQTSWAGPSGADTQEVFVVKLLPTLVAPNPPTTATYFTFLPGNAKDGSAGIALDNISTGCTTAGSACAAIIGTTTSTNSKTGLNPFQASNAGGNDIYISKLNSGATAHVYSTYLGGTGNEEALGFQNIAVDANGETWITGKTTSTVANGFPNTNAITTPAGLTDLSGVTAAAFVLKFAASTTAADLSFSTYLAGTTSAVSDVGAGIAVDSTASNAYVTGIAASTNFPTTAGVIDTTQNGGLDGFISKIQTLPITHTGTPTTFSSAGGTANVVLNVVSGVANGDAMLVGITYRGNPMAAPTGTGPSNWTLVFQQDSTAGNSGSLLVYRRIASSEPASYTWTFSASTRDMTGAMVLFRNVNPTSPLDGTPASQGTASATTHAAPSITTTQLSVGRIMDHPIGAIMDQGTAPTFTL